MTKHTVSFVDISAIYHHLGLTDAEVEMVDVVGFQDVSYGDAELTLVGNQYAWHSISSVILDDARMKHLHEKYWNVVAVDDYINLEN